MNKKNSIFVITGIFLICTRFWVSFGTVNIDISNDIVGYILIFLGINNMKELNSRFKKGMILSLAGLAGAILSQYLIARDLLCARDYVFYSNRYQCRICYIFYLLLYRSPCHGSKDTRKTAVTRNYQITWLLMSAGIFIHYFAFKSTITMWSILVEALIAVITIYYCFLVFSTSRQLYED